MSKQPSAPVIAIAAIIVIGAGCALGYVFESRAKQEAQNAALARQVMELSARISELQASLNATISATVPPPSDRVLVSGTGFAIHGSGLCQQSYALRNDGASSKGTMTTVLIGTVSVGRVLSVPPGAAAEVPSGFKLAFKTDRQTDRQSVYASFDRLELGAYEGPGCSLSVKTE